VRIGCRSARKGLGRRGVGVGARQWSETESVAYGTQGCVRNSIGRAAIGDLFYRQALVVTLFRPRFRGGGAGAVVFALGCSTGCTTVDPGPTFAVADVSFDADYFYCHVEPELIVAKNCGPGDPAKGDSSSGCHFTASAVSGMVLLDHPAIDCGGGDHPVNLAQIGMGSAAQNNFEVVSLEMNKADYTSSPLLLRPSGTYHPRPIFNVNDPQVTQLLKAWASK
jgi:hypothetical protein